MYGPLSMYLKSTDPAGVEEVVQRIAAVFRQRDGFPSCTTSVDALMGPAAKSGEFARVVVVDFDTLEDALGALQSDAFADVAAASEQLGRVNYLFECREV